MTGKFSIADSKSNPYSAEALPVGTMLNEYQILSVLGRGSFGITYLAIDTHLHRQAAIKEYLPVDFAVRLEDSTVNPSTDSHIDLFQYGLDSFLNEARTLVKFKHHNIVQVLSYFECNKTAYFVMEYEIGQNLNNFFKTHPNLSEKVLLTIFLPIIEGLDIVHQHGFIHRDIKPDNIYIRDDNSPVLLDFGAARNIVKTNSELLTRILTKGYAPYEQDNPSWKSQGAWTDIYSLGATIYLALTGNKPVSASHRAAAYMSNQGDPYVSVHKSVKGDFSHSFLDAIDTALAFEPERRPQSLKEWNQILTLGPADSTRIIQPPSTPNTRQAYDNGDRETHLISKPKLAQINNSFLNKYILKTPPIKWVIALSIFSLIFVAIYVTDYILYNTKNIHAEKNIKDLEKISDLPKELVGTSMLLAKTACWHFERGESFKNLINDIKQLPLDSDRTRFIAEQTKKIYESQKGFENNFSQYSVAVIKMRGYPVKAIMDGIDYFLQLPDYRNNSTYKLLSDTVLKHATGDEINIEEWKNDLISFTQNKSV